jgi:serine/threonine-protein kinase RsbW
VDGGEFATVCYAELEPATGVLRYACAGHPPPVVVLPDGETRFLTGGRSAPLCGLGPPRRGEARDDLPPGALLALYSDGLVERRGHQLDRRLERLADALRMHRNVPPDRLAAAVVREMTRGVSLTDDIALLVVRRDAIPAARFRRRFPARADELAALRGALRSWLADAGVPGPDWPDVVLAVGEACTNAVEHGHASVGGDVEVTAQLDGGVLTIRVRDGGAWRTPGAPGDRGRGIGIMRQLMEDVAVDSDGAGTTVTLRRRVPG